MTPPAEKPSAPVLEKQPFGTTPDGDAVELYTLRNNRGAVVKIMTYGGIVTHLIVPDKHGKMGDVVLGFDHLEGYVSEDYLSANPFFGALIGRFGNRIAQGQFNLDGTTYSLAANNGPNALHGGIQGFDKIVWEARRAEVTPEGPRLELGYLSHNGEEAYPGNLRVTAVYTFTNDNALRLDFTATTDQATVVNLTQHSYFNLRGHGDITGHLVQIAADHITPIDSTLIPTGELMPVDGTPFDFRTATPAGARIDAEDQQLEYGGGYDHNWVLNKAEGTLDLIATVTEPESGRKLEVFSTEPGVQFYSGNFLNGTLTGKNDWVYEFRHGLCLEPQHFPDSPNQPNFPNTVLRPGETYRNTIIYKLSLAQ